MTVKFFNGRKLVYTMVTSGINNAIQFVNKQGVNWTRYKIVEGD